jgi:TonB family protein
MRLFSRNVGRGLGKCPAWEQEAMAFSFGCLSFNLCADAKSGGSVAKGEVMRWLACLLLVVVSIVSRAGEVFLIPEHNPKPIYPSQLQRAGIIGDIQVNFIVKADGSVTKVNILQSNHPELAEAARVAVEQWRFKPWRVEENKPAEQEVRAPMVFRLDMPSDVNQWLKEVKCREVNEKFVHAPEYALADTAPFHFTRAYLSNSFFQKQLSNEQRLEMIAKLNKRAPTIARNCLNNPMRRYMSFLPQDIRNLL